MTDNPKKKLKILLLEDRKQDVLLISHHLEKLPFPFELKHTYDRSDFIDYLQHFKPDIILSDYNLPAYSGLEALIESQQICPYTPFIFVTGTIGSELAEETIIGGASGFVIKSDYNELIKIITNFFGTSDENDESRLRQNLNQTEKEIKRLKQIIDASNRPVQETVDRIDETIKKMETIKETFLKKKEK